MRVPKLLLFHLDREHQQNDTTEKAINKSLIMTEYEQSNI